MTIEVRVPNLPESVADATLVNWHKKPGESVVKDESLADLETDKVVLEVPAPCSGILSEVNQAEGATVVSGDILARIDENAQSKPTLTSGSNTEHQQPSGDMPLSPAVRRLVSELDLDPRKIKGTGKHGRLVKTDILNYLEQTTSTEPAVPLTKETEVDEPETTIAGPDITGTRPEQRVPMTRLRAKIAERLVQSQQNSAMLTTFNEVNMKSIIDLRQQNKDRFESKYQVKLGFMSFFVKATVEALKNFPAINASIDDNDIIYHGYYDIGIAVSSARGLTVPIIRDADQLDFADIEKQIAGFAQKARDGSLTYEDLNGGTFTITNGGIFGSMLSTPIINPPQCAILGMHSIKERPVVENGEIVIRPIMYLALSYDHRLVDGQEAVQFLVAIKNYLESPANMLLHI